MKTIHYLSGLPRSGNTVLSALLNQNPKLYSSPISPISQLMYTTEFECFTNEGFNRSPNYEGINSVLKNMLSNYYSGIEQDIIFDREKNWTTPNNLEVNPLSKAPNSLEEPTKIEFTDETLPRISSGV